VRDQKGKGLIYILSEKKGHFGTMASYPKRGEGKDRQWENIEANEKWASHLAVDTMN